MTTAAQRWRADLEAWALPQELLDAVEESPYGWPADLFRRMQRLEGGASHTAQRAVQLAGPNGTVIDVGAGTGRVGLAAARNGSSVTFVERSDRMLEGLRAAIAEVGIERARVVSGSWPDVASSVGMHDVAMCANVVYDVQDIGPFLSGLAAVATRAVVVEATPNHPWSHLSPYYRRLHGLDRPAGPTMEDLADVVVEVLGVDPTIERWIQPASMRFADIQELLELIGRRLVVPADRWSEVMDAIGPDIREEDGWVYLGEPVREMAMLVALMR